MHSRYKKVSQEDKHVDNDEKVKKEKAELSERLNVKIHVCNLMLIFSQCLTSLLDSKALFWVLLAAFIAYYTNIFERAFYDPHVSRYCF